MLWEHEPQETNLITELISAAAKLANSLYVDRKCGKDYSDVFAIVTFTELSD